MTPFDPILTRRWADATRRAVAHAGGLKVAAALTGQSIAWLSRCQGASHADRLSERDALTLTVETGTPAFAELFCDLAGLSPAAIADDVVPASLLDAQAAAVAECSEVIHRLVEACRDGVLDSAEQARLRRVIGDLRDALADFDGLMAAAAGRSVPVR